MWTIQKTIPQLTSAIHVIQGHLISSYPKEMQCDRVVSTLQAEAYKEWQDSNEEIHENPVDNPDTPHIETSVEETLTKPTDSDKSGSGRLCLVAQWIEQ